MKDGLKGRGRGVQLAAGAVIAMTMMTLMTGVAVAQTGGYDSTYWSGHVQQSNGFCVGVFPQILQEGKAVNQRPGWPEMSTDATLDAGSSCQIQNAVAPAWRLDTEQDLVWYDAHFNQQPYCNRGPQIQNPVASHSIHTDYGWLSGYQPPCGDVYYHEDSWVWYDPVQTQTWQGSYHSTNWLYVWSTNG